MKHALELKPLIVAAGIGALALWILRRQPTSFAIGAGVGAAVQIGVRLAGVS